MKLSRSTAETKVSVELSLWGKGKASIRVDDRFLKHMLETLAKFASFDLKINATGDLLHHVAEDIAITLGNAFREELKGKQVKRIAHAVVPMDDALVMGAVDLVGRPYADVEAPNSLYAHFLRTFALEAAVTLHVKPLAGKDEHHLIEASFKAVGAALKDALSPVDKLISTKGDVVVS